MDGWGVRSEAGGWGWGWGKGWDRGGRGGRCRAGAGLVARVVVGGYLFPRPSVCLSLPASLPLSPGLRILPLTSLSLFQTRALS